MVPGQLKTSMENGKYDLFSFGKYPIIFPVKKNIYIKKEPIRSIVRKHKRVRETPSK